MKLSSKISNCLLIISPIFSLMGCSSNSYHPTPIYHKAIQSNKDRQDFSIANSYLSTDSLRDNRENANLQSFIFQSSTCHGWFCVNVGVLPLELGYTPIWVIHPRLSLDWNTRGSLFIGFQRFESGPRLNIEPILDLIITLGSQWGIR